MTPNRAELARINDQVILLMRRLGTFEYVESDADHNDARNRLYMELKSLEAITDSLTVLLHRFDAGADAEDTSESDDRPPQAEEGPALAQMPEPAATRVRLESPATPKPLRRPEGFWVESPRAEVGLELPTILKNFQLSKRRNEEHVETVVESEKPAPKTKRGRGGGGAGGGGGGGGGRRRKKTAPGGASHAIEKGVEEEGKEKRPEDTTHHVQIFSNRLMLLRAQALLQAYRQAPLDPTFQSTNKNNNDDDDHDKGEWVDRIIALTGRIDAAQGTTLLKRFELCCLYVQLSRHMDQLRPPDLVRNLGHHNSVVAEQCGWSEARLSSCLLQGKKVEAATGGHSGLISFLPFRKIGDCPLTVAKNVYKENLTELRKRGAEGLDSRGLRAYCRLGGELQDLVLGNTQSLSKSLEEALNPARDYCAMQESDVEVIVVELGKEPCECPTEGNEEHAEPS